MAASWTQWNFLTPSTLLRAPNKPGVYEVALHGRRHRYPGGFSSTIYYGMSDSDIAARLSAHHTGRGNSLIRDLLAAQERLKVRWRRTANARKPPREIECWHLGRFAERFGSHRLGNLRGCTIIDH